MCAKLLTGRKKEEQEDEGGRIFERKIHGSQFVHMLLKWFAAFKARPLADPR